MQSGPSAAGDNIRGSSSGSEPRRAAAAGDTGGPEVEEEPGAEMQTGRGGDEERAIKIPRAPENPTKAQVEEHRARAH
eukprot:12312126-Heterocapsa_arctica.AAC.1